MSARAVAVLAALSFAAPATAWEQTQTKFPNGIGLRWNASQVTYTVNTTRPNSSPSCAASGASDPGLAAVEAAFATWSNATQPGAAAPCTKLSLVYGGPSSSTSVGTGTAGEHLVVFRQGWCSNNAAAIASGCVGQSRPGTNGEEPACNNLFNCFDDTYGSMSRNVLALTTVMYTPSSGAIGDADMEIVDWDGASGSLGGTPPDGWYWTCGSTGPVCTSYGQAGCVFMDLQNTVTHEAGHFIGLAHPCEMDSATAAAYGVPVCNGGAMAQTTMYPSATIAETSKRDLAPDDVNGVCSIYGTLTSGSAAKSSSGGCGAGGATPVGLMVLAVALAALTPRRRRGRR